jgi:hypothetical protein
MGFLALILGINTFNSLSLFLILFLLFLLHEHANQRQVSLASFDIIYSELAGYSFCFSHQFLYMKSQSRMLAQH